MSLLDQRLSRMQEDHLTMRDKTSILWHEKETTDFQSLLNNQVNALNLLLTALQCKSIIEQRLFLQRSETRVVFNRIKDDTSSLLWLRDSDSEMTKKSIVAEDLSLIETRFAFDSDLFSSRVYCSAARSTMVHALKGTTVKPSYTEASVVPDDNATERAFSIMSDEEASIIWRPTEYNPNQRHPTHSINTGRAWSLREGLSRPRTAPSLVSSMLLSRQRSRATSLVSVRQAKKSSQWLSSIALWNLWGGEASPYPSTADSIVETAPVEPVSQRVLLLGSSKSGKSTALNVLNLLVGCPSDMSQLFQSRLTILESLSNQLRQLLEVGERLCTGDSVDEEYAVMRSTSDSVTRLLETLHEISTGITLARYTNGPSEVIFCDASGSRGERKKWNRIFDGATKVLYFVDAGSYDQTLTEDNHANRLAEELTLFDSVCSAAKLSHVEIVLFIHKVDKLERKLRTVPFDSTIFDNWGMFSGEPQSVDDVRDYLYNTFSAIAQKSSRSISVTFTSLKRPEELGKTILSYASSVVNMV
ncbi:G-protein alpha subunit-domain-containing protein [Aspergillus pseudonomiae]|uniref:G-protein alpha subunit-domain-containing protein n=1 Tax=Aspergillus pseudonomiae TaxID=1506151 RepID=A0A5N7D8T2_9EURO|nr:G-protein alpha subunit-domain-containing protein [Aspergillus pseudonomiae]KAB8262101.1 G-protein alpha subunit-domain-containing protein [Aspergillus pseudonomiae]KAE8402679.1 G-protein alpha subunit-domain-containing protein [Aspergillus pseudonomiae]